MRKVESGIIKLKDIKFLENSRFRVNYDVSDLMGDIKQYGLLQNIGIRKEDNAIIYGNRRVKAFEKLGITEIPCDFYEDVDDEQLLILNVNENIKSKNISTVEIGRICDLLIKKGLTSSEIAEKMTITKSKVRNCLCSYQITKGTPFDKLVNSHSNIVKGVSESFIYTANSTLQPTHNKNFKLTKDNWDILLKAAEKGELTIPHLPMLRSVLETYQDINLKQAIKLLANCEVIHGRIALNASELFKEMKKNKSSSKLDLIYHIIREYNKELLF